MNRAMPERPGMFDKLRNSVQSGWNRLRDRLNVIGVETKLETQLFREVVEVVKETVEPIGEGVKKVWELSGNNFAERLRNTTSFALTRVREGINRLRENVDERVDDLRERYRSEGVVGATLGIVTEALDSVREFPASYGQNYNNLRANVEEIKLELINERQDNVPTVNGWREQYALLDKTYDHVVERRNIFEERRQRCADRLEAMRQGRERFIRARSNVVVMMPITA